MIDTHVVANEPVLGKENPEIIKKDEPAQTETIEDINWKKFREVRDKERKEKEEAQALNAKTEKEKQALQEALEAVLNKKPDDSRREDAPDELEEKIARALEKRDRQSQKERQMKEREEEPAKLKTTFPDFEKVCSQQNVDYLEYHHPELFTALKKMPDGFEKWSHVYNSLKRYIPNMDTQKDLKKAEQNLKKPQAATNAMANTADAAPFGQLTEDRKKANFARMQRALKDLD